MFEQRLNEIVFHTACMAARRPLRESGLWHHGDIRNNFYDASYIIAAAADTTMELPFDRMEAVERAERVLLQVVRLQDRTPGSATYGHWPLGLDPDPAEAKPNPLPAELMGLLMAYFVKRYRHVLSESLQAEFRIAFETLYRSDFYRTPLYHYHHHEAKYTAAKLIYGTMFGDAGLLDDGIACLKATLDRIKSAGMTEYGCLPWFWHWIQAFACAFHCVERQDIKDMLAEMLDFLWEERAAFYWKGTWIGAHSRGLAHDIPSDGNVLFDYVQFGDFSFPETVPRVEYAGLLFYPAPDSVRALAVGRSFPAEVKKLVPPKPEASAYETLHSYVYVEEHYAVGGMWERTLEFDNEQHRWSATLPLTGNGDANKAFFFHPGAGFAGEDSADWRHQSEVEEVLLHRNVVMALYPISDEGPDYIVGCLPKGRWLDQDRAIFGQCGDVYIAVYLMQPYRMTLTDRAWRVISPGRANGVVMEVVDGRAARQAGMADLESFASARLATKAVFDQEKLAASYETTSGDVLELRCDRRDAVKRSVNGVPVRFDGYER